MTPQSTPKESPHEAYLPHLDSVRGLAALFVFNVHYAGGFGDPLFALRETPFSILIDGKAAICMFFVLSGMVLSRKSFQVDAVKLEVGAFYVRRFFRINLPFFAALLLAWTAWRVGWIRHETSPEISRWMFGLWTDVAELNFLGVVRQALLIIPNTPQSLISPAWTLVIEIQMSLAVPLLILLCRRGSGWLVLFTGLVIPLLLSCTGFSNAIFLVHFTCGVLLARHDAEWSKVSTRLHPLLKALALFVGLLLLTLGNPFLEIQKGLPTAYSHGLMAVGASLWLFVFSGSRWAISFLTLRPLRSLGRVSYAFYICHVPLLISVTPLAIKILNSIGIVGNPAYWLGYVLSIALVTSFSAVFFRVVERPSIQLGRFLGDQIRDARLFV